MVELFIANDLAEIHSPLCCERTNYAGISCDFFACFSFAIVEQRAGQTRVSPQGISEVVTINS